MEKHMSDMKKEFVQKYMLDDYSRAMPARVSQGQSAATLGEYCDPVDSAHNKHDGEGNSSDSDSGYALPEDTIIVKKPTPVHRNSRDDLDNDDNLVYELAQNAVGPYDTPPPARQAEMSNRKPSPKPRGSKKQRSIDDVEKTSKDFEKLKAHDHQSYHGGRTLVEGTEPSASHSDKRRPSKKVVEIEYEVASSIRSSRSDMPVSSTAVGPPVLPPTNSESLYEEPWDLKVKRLKQEEEEKKLKKQSKPRPPVQSVPMPSAQIPVYEEAWDSVAQQKKLEASLSFARSFSLTSEAEIFHDAVDSTATESAHEAQGAAGPLSHPKAGGQAEAPPAYEDAWDLKTSIIDQKIKEMQIQASATYEEPWDSTKQQQQLQSRLERTSLGMIQVEKPRERSSSDAYEQAWQMKAVKKPVHRDKHHSVDESRSRNKLKGCSIGQRINPIIPLVNQNWYHGNISRDDAEKMLCVCKEGSYIVRISSDRKSYSLSIKSAKQYIHVQIEQVICDDGSIHFILGKNSKEFCTIPEMIDYYTHHRVPLKGAEHITLLHPVECKWS